MSMGRNSDGKDGSFLAVLVVRLFAPVGGVQLTAVDLSCVNERGIWAWSQAQRAHLENEQGRVTLRLHSYTTLAGAPAVGRGGCLLSIERDLRPRLPVQHPYEWDKKGTCFVLDIQWIEGDGHQQKQRYCFEWQGARSVVTTSAPPSPPRLGVEELLRYQHQGLLQPHERKMLESVDDEERYLLLRYPEHYQGRQRPTIGPNYDALLNILSALQERDSQEL